MSGTRGERFEPQVGTVYRNKGGGSYRCEDSWKSYGDEPGWNAPDRWDAWMTNVKSGWCVKAHGLIRYPDGTIEWDYSSDGHFRTKEMQNA